MSSEKSLSILGQSQKLTIGIKPWNIESSEKVEVSNEKKERTSSKKNLVYQKDSPKKNPINQQEEPS